jgi:hypothetical protein
VALVRLEWSVEDDVVAVGVIRFYPIPRGSREVGRAEPLEL